MKSKRSERLTEEKRQALLQAAIVEFGRQGFAGANINRIAASAGITRGLVYYYFDDRDDLLREAIGVVKQRLLTAIGEIEPPTNVTGYFALLERNYRIARSLFLLDPDLRPFFRQMVLGVQGPDAPLPVQEVRATIREVMAVFLRLGQTFDAVRMDLPESLLVSSLLAQVATCDLWMLEAVEAGEDPEVGMQTSVRLLIGLVAAPGYRPDERSAAAPREVP